MLLLAQRRTSGAPLRSRKNKIINCKYIHLTFGNNINYYEIHFSQFFFTLKCLYIYWHPFPPTHVQLITSWPLYVTIQWDCGLTIILYRRVTINTRIYFVLWSSLEEYLPGKRLFIIIIQISVSIVFKTHHRRKQKL